MQARLRWVPGSSCLRKNLGACVVPAPEMFIADVRSTFLNQATDATRPETSIAIAVCARQLTVSQPAANSRLIQAVCTRARRVHDEQRRSGMGLLCGTSQGCSRDCPRISRNAAFTQGAA